MIDFGPLFHPHDQPAPLRDQKGTGIECPECCETSGVHRTLRHDDWTERVRVCNATYPHVFRTREVPLRGERLRCASCWTENETVRTQNYGDHIRRTRRCTVCRHIFKTKESVYEHRG